jgi:hypothetical protein
VDDLLDRLRAFTALRDLLGGERADKVFRRSLPSCPPEFAPEDYLGRMGCIFWLNRSETVVNSSVNWGATCYRSRDLGARALSPCCVLGRRR